MVAKIKTGRSIIGALNYNEHKVRQGKADLISAQGYLRDPLALTFSDKLDRLTDLAKRNERTLVNTLHVSLNFAVTEYLKRDTLQQIADDYMHGLGFGNQPYLVYQHHDSGHPHLHIVSTNIQHDGRRISFHLLANRASEDARKQVELTYNLIKAEDQDKQQHAIATPLTKVIYGKSEIKRSIATVVNEVIRSYNCTSLPELNAVLNYYNIAADRGAKESRMFTKNGLIYWALDGRGSKIGVPVKASSLYGKPTLSTLEGRFRLNEMLRKPLKDELKTSIDPVLIRPVSNTAFKNLMKEKGVDVLYRENNEGRLYGITFIDHRSKAVFNGSELGKNYKAAAFSGWFLKEETAAVKKLPLMPSNAISARGSTDNISGSPSSGNSLLELLLKDEQQDMQALNRFVQRKRRKKNRGQSL